MSRPDTIADIRGRSTTGSASDVNRSPAIGHARPPGQSADWPHDAPSMTRADAVSSATRLGSGVAPRHGAYSLRAEGGASLRIVRAGSVTEVSSSQSSRSRKGMWGDAAQCPGLPARADTPPAFANGSHREMFPDRQVGSDFHPKTIDLLKRPFGPRVGVAYRFREKWVARAGNGSTNQAHGGEARWSRPWNALLRSDRLRRSK